MSEMAAGRRNASPATPDEVIAAAHQIGEAASPHVGRHDREGSFVTEGYEAIRAARYGAIAVPAELGGGDHSLETVCRAQAALGGHCASTALAIAMHQHNVLTMAWRWRMGDDSVEGPLVRVAEEGLLLSSSGSADLTNTGVTATETDGGYLVSGRKGYCSGVPGADLISVAAGLASDPEHVVSVLVPAHDPGVTIRADWDAMGMRGSGSNGVTFQAVFVPQANVIGRRRVGPGRRLRPAAVPGAGPSDPTLGGRDLVARAGGPPPVLQLWPGGARRGSRIPGLQVALTVIASVYLGAAGAVRDLALARIAGTERARDPARQQLVGLMTMELRSGWWALEALWRATDDDSLGTEAHFVTTMLAKRQVVVNSIAIAEQAMELVGGASYFRDQPFEQALRDIRAAVTHPLSPEATLLEVGRSTLESTGGRIERGTP